MASRSKKPSKIRRLAPILLIAPIFLLAAPLVLIAIYRFSPPPATPLMILRLFEGEGIRKDWVPLRRISPRLVRSVVALEDTKFCEHDGIDWDEIFVALSDHLKGKRLRGASTISMQTTKNLLLWPGRDYIRKGLEIPLTFWMELLWEKRRIIEMYLNIAEWGPGIYGAEMAARTYFGKSAAQLTQWEAARMAAVLPNPRRWSPSRPTAYIRSRAYTAVARNGDLGRLRCTLPTRRSRWR